MSKTFKKQPHDRRDLNARALIFRNGDGPHTDQKKKASRNACRRWQADKGDE